MKPKAPTLRWRPIKTAPRDQIILLAQPPHNPDEYGWYVCQGRYLDIAHVNEVHVCLREGKPVVGQMGGFHPHWAATYDGIMDIGTAHASYKGYESRSNIVYPSHWMPLPPPPRGRYKQPPGEQWT